MSQKTQRERQNLIFHTEEETSIRTPLYRSILENPATSQRHVGGTDGKPLCTSKDKALKSVGEMNIFSASEYVSCRECSKIIASEIEKYKEEGK